MFCGNSTTSKPDEMGVNQFTAEQKLIWKNKLKLVRFAYWKYLATKPVNGDEVK